jgi:signal transduction histidine kinase
VPKFPLSWLAAIRRLRAHSDDPRIVEEQNRTLLYRAQAACWVAAAVMPFTILSFDAFFASELLLGGLVIAGVAVTAAMLVAWAVRLHWFDRWPAVPFAILVGVVCNATECAHIAITGGPLESNFFFPYYLLFFGIATFFPAPIGYVVLTSLLLPMGYALLGWAMIGEPSDRLLSSIILLVDYAGITIIANRIVTSIFIKELELRMDLEAANTRLREVDRLKSEFFANISHELRTPLTLILAPTASLLEETPGKLTSDQRVLIEEVRRNAARQLLLINDLLLLTRLDSGQVRPSTSSVELTQLVRSTAESMRPHAESLGLTVEIDLPEQANWHGDPRHIDRMLLNLLSNACKFSESGKKVEVRLEVKEQELILSVRDEGIGIAEKDVGRLFERFVQIDSGANRRFEGTGIGLAITKELAEIYGGRVEVESAVGKGSTFRIVLPRDETSGDLAVWGEPTGSIEVTTLAYQPVESSDEQVVPEFLREGTVPSLVVVEDNDDLRAFLRQELGRWYHVSALGDSMEALHHLQSVGADLVVTDVMMPVMDGIQLVQRLRDLSSTKDIPILLLSAREDVETKLRGFAAGADDYVEKPFQMAELRARIDLHLRLRDQTRQLKEAQTALMRQEKMALLGTVVAGVAHETNNPLHFLQGNLRILSERLQRLIPDGSGDVAEILSDMEESLSRIARVTRQLLTFGRQNNADFTEVALGEVVELAIKMAKAKAAPHVQLINSLEGSEKVRANPQELFQVLLNLIQNAVQAMDDRPGQVRVRAVESDGVVSIRIEDDGVGIPQENLRHVFEPFFTTKAAGTGTGLGLAIVRQLVEAQGGHIELESEVGRGTTVCVRLPR